ncbi:hypothetical protein D3C87_2157270 [compost metagenome]
MFFWPIAANEPSSMEAIEMKTMTCCQSVNTGWNALMTMRVIIAMAATFGALARKAVTGVGAPS